MNRRELPFKYRLSSLLKVDQWEGRLLGVELRRARQVLDENQRLHRDVLQKIASAESEMRNLHQADAQIPLERTQMLSVYLQDQHAQAKVRGNDVSNAERLFEQIMTQRQAKQQKIRALENHQGREQMAHDVEQTRAGHRDADDLWLNMHNRNR